jgi:signal transduction histidine kinase
MPNLDKKNLKTLVIILTTVTICTSIYFLKETRIDEILFIFSAIIGLVLIRNSFQEERQRKNIYSLMTKSNNLTTRLKELDNLKTEFVSLATHQLRSPLAKIQGYSSMILEEEFGKIPPELKEPLQRIFLSSQNLGSLLNDFLDVAQIEKGEIVYDLKPCNLIDILNRVEENFKDVFDNTGLDLQVTYDKTDNIKVLADFGKTLSAISKIVDNAVRYTPQGSIKISLAEKEDDVIITIKDTGVGIEQAEIDELFEKFRRGKNAYNISVSGSGLGLYVAREIIEAHEGRIWLKSDGPGKGTTAFIAFPLLRI